MLTANTPGIIPIFSSNKMADENPFAFKNSNSLSLLSHIRMQSKVEDSVRTKMESLRLICDKEIPIQQQKMDSCTASHRESLNSIIARVHETVQNQAKLRKMDGDLREAKDEFVKVLAVKTCKVAKWMAIKDSISITKARIQELKRKVQEQRSRRDEYAAIISQHNLVLGTSEGIAKEDIEQKGEIHKAKVWYKRNLGFQVEGGHGVKFIFSNINLKSPKEEYSFIIRHANDTYTLLDCDPHLNDTKELINELNRTNGLFNFVRIMRKKFQEAVALGSLPRSTTFCQDSSTISLSAPFSSVSTDRSKSTENKSEHEVEHGEVHRRRGAKVAVRSLGSTSSPR